MIYIKDASDVCHLSNDNIHTVHYPTLKKTYKNTPKSNHKDGLLIAILFILRKKNSCGEKKTILTKFIKEIGIPNYYLDEGNKLHLFYVYYDKLTVIHVEFANGIYDTFSTVKYKDFKKQLGQMVKNWEEYNQV